MVDLTFRTLGPWGSGKGANLVPAEVDNNFWELAQAIVDLAASPAVPVGIASITVSGTQMSITLTDGTVLGPYTLPVLTFRWRGDWQPSTIYAQLDVVSVAASGIYLVQIAHTSGATFDPNLLIAGSPAFMTLFGMTTTTGLSAIGNAQILANTSGASALPVGNTLTALIDYCLPEIPVNGNILQRAADVWHSIRKPYVIGISAPTGVLAANQVLGHHSVAAGITIQANFGAYQNLSCRAGGTANATATTTITVQRATLGTGAWTTLGTISFAAGTITPTFVTIGGTSQSANSGDVIRAIGPATPDTTFADFYMTLVGYET